MNKKDSKSALFLLAAILFLMSMPKIFVETSKDVAVGWIAPGWELLSNYNRHPFLSAQDIFFSSGDGQGNSFELSNNEHVEQLQLENELLRLELARLREYCQKESIYRQLSSMDAIPARVIFRSPQSWNSSLWVNVGTADNKGYESPIVAKNSPVLLADSVIGVLDYVGRHQSRVRLITDSGLTLSVRAVREEKGEDQKIYKRFLAKGELHGGSEPLWRSQGAVLKGTGFNYDFSDEKGPARDLRTGVPLKKDPRFPPQSIIDVKDLLVTTGMDGVFSEGLKVGEVSCIQPLKEGDYYYELDAKPTAGSLEDLSLVFIVAPVGYDPLDQPNK